MITTLNVTLSRFSYSRYEAAASGSIVEATVTPVGTTGDVYTVSMIRATRGADLLVSSQPVTIVTSGVPVVVQFNLRTLVDADGLSSVPCSLDRDDYRIEARAVVGTVSDAVPFTVVPLLPEEMRKRWLKGLPLTNLPGGIPYSVSDEEIVEVTLHAYAEAAAFLHVNLEPRLVVTSRLISSHEENPVLSWDVLSIPVGYYRRPGYVPWQSISLPHHSVLSLRRLEGWFNKTRVINFTSDWWVVQPTSGLISLVPSTGALLQYEIIGSAYYGMFLNKVNIPEFWEYFAVCGMREVPAPLQEYIARAAALEILSQLAQALRPYGEVALTISRDGVSESHSYAPLGAYSALMAQYQRMNGYDEKTGQNKGLDRLRQRYVGLDMVTL